MPPQAKLFGPAELLVRGEWRPFPLDKRGGLLAVLALAGGPVPRSRLARLFWSDASSGRARTNLRGLLARLRTAELHAGIYQGSDALAWEVQTDVSAFELAIRRSEWLTAARINNGTFLADLELDDAPEFSAWLELERRRFEDERKRAFTLAANGLASSGNVGEALKLLGEARRQDPLDESVVQACLRFAQLDVGTAAEVLRDLDNFIALLADELGLEPAPHTVALAEELRLQAAKPTRRAAEHVPPRRFRDIEGRLPHPVAPSIRRDREVPDLASLLADPECRWVTLTGPAGIGKTALALQVAHEVQSSFRSGAHWFSLVGVSDIVELPVVLSNGLAIPLERVADVYERLLNRLRGTETLLVLDDLDGLPDAASFITDLLENTLHVKVLATRRSSFKAKLEAEVRVNGLTYADSDNVEAAESYAAFRLFVLRARQVRGDRRVTPDEVPAIVDICRLVEGSPLGIELAAGRTAVSSVADVLDVIRRDAGAVAADTRNRPARHRSLRAAFDHAWHDLRAEDRSAMAALSAFRGPFGVDAAVGVAAVTHESLVTLLDRSFLKRDEAGRLTFHALVRQFAAQELRRTPVAESKVHSRHARYFAKEVERHGRWLRGGKLQLASLKELVLHLDDVHAAWDHFRDAGDADWLSLFFPLLHLYEIRGLYEIGEASFDAMARVLPDRSATRARALTASAILAGRAEHFEASRKAVAESLSIWADLGEEDALSHLHVGVLAWHENDLEDAEAAWSRARDIAEATGEEWCRLSAVGNLGIFALHAGHLNRAADLLNEAYQGSLSIQDGWGRSFAEVNLGTLALARGDPRTARTHFLAGLDIARGLDQARIVMEALSCLVALAEAEDRPEEVTRRRRELEEAAARYGLTVR